MRFIFRFRRFHKDLLSKKDRARPLPFFTRARDIIWGRIRWRVGFTLHFSPHYPSIPLYLFLSLSLPLFPSLSLSLSLSLPPSLSLSLPPSLYLSFYLSFSLFPSLSLLFIIIPLSPSLSFSPSLSPSLSLLLSLSLSFSPSLSLSYLSLPLYIYPSTFLSLFLLFIILIGVFNGRKCMTYRDTAYLKTLFFDTLYLYFKRWWSLSWIEDGSSNLKSIL